MNKSIGVAIVLLFALCFWMCGPSNNPAQEVVTGEKSDVPTQINIATNVNASPTTVIDPENLDVSLLVRLIEEGINKERVANGISPLEQNKQLMKAAREKNDYQTILGIPNERQSETSVRSIVDKVNFYGSNFRLVGENIQYYGLTMQRLEGVFSLLAPEYHKAAEDIVARWIASPEDHENIVNDAFTNVGTGIAWSDETKALFATQVFGGQ